MGCGSGRWAMLVAPKIAKLNCIEPSSEALKVAHHNLSHLSNVNFECGVSEESLPANSQDLVIPWAFFIISQIAKEHFRIVSRC